MNIVELVVRYADLVTTIVLVGGVTYAAWVAPPTRSARRVLGFAAYLFAAALLGELGLNAFHMHRVSGIGGMTLIADVLQMHWSRWWMLRCVALGMIAGGLWIDDPPWQWLGAIGIVSLVARSFQGHAGAHGTTAAIMDWVHLGAAAVWVGGLAQLALASSVSSATAARASRLFTIALGPLVVAGVYGALVHVSAVELLVTSAYGRVLVAKVSLAALAIGLGAMNHFRHVPALAKGRGGASLLRAVRAELVVAAVVLLLTALLVSLPMPHVTTP